MTTETVTETQFTDARNTCPEQEDALQRLEEQRRGRRTIIEQKVTTHTVNGEYYTLEARDSDQAELSRLDGLIDQAELDLKESREVVRKYLVQDAESERSVSLELMRNVCADTLGDSKRCVSLLQEFLTTLKRLYEPFGVFERLEMRHGKSVTELRALGETTDGIMPEFPAGPAEILSALNRELAVPPPNREPDKIPSYFPNLKTVVKPSAKTILRAKLQARKAQARVREPETPSIPPAIVAEIGEAEATA